jgi:hypothetical protein
MYPLRPDGNLAPVTEGIQGDLSLKVEEILRKKLRRGL